ncbi:MAG: hypothetical protein U0176_13055 [Bacteroidia bacterium]
MATTSGSYPCKSSNPVVAQPFPPHRRRDREPASGHTDHYRRWISTTCAGGSVTLTSSSANGYLWTPRRRDHQSINATTSGSYTVRVTDANGCSSTSAPTVVTVNAAPATPTITPSGPTSFCAGGSVTLTSSTANAYLWTPGSATTQSINVTTSGSYTVRVTDANGCTATSAPTTVTVTALPATPTITPSGPDDILRRGQRDPYLQQHQRQHGFSAVPPPKASTSPPAALTPSQ